MTTVSWEDLERLLSELDHGDTDSYDGQHEPQLRELTARERDVLCRIISLVLHEPMFEGEERARLRLIRYIITPRHQDRSL